MSLTKEWNIKNVSKGDIAICGIFSIEKEYFVNKNFNVCGRDHRKRISPQVTTLYIAIECFVKVFSSDETAKYLYLCVTMNLAVATVLYYIYLS